MTINKNTTNILVNKGLNQNLVNIGSLKFFHSTSYLLADSQKIETFTDPAIVENKLNMIKNYNELMNEKEYENWKETSSSYSESFKDVEDNDPFFGVIPKILKYMVKTENLNISLEDLIKDKGWLGTITFLLQKYPLSTILQNKSNEIHITPKELDEISILKQKVTNMEEQIKSLENTKEVFLELESKLDNLAKRSVQVLQTVDKVDYALIGLQFISPFLIYRGILNTYGKMVIDSSYIPKSLEEQKIIEQNRVKIINRFNRIGIPILVFSYLLVSQVNIERNKEIIESIKKPISDLFNRESSSSVTSSLFLFLTKNKNNLLIFLILILMFLIWNTILPGISNNYPWLYNLLNLYGLKISICLIFIWVLILSLESTLELIIYKIYIQNNAKIKFPLIIEWLINIHYKDLWDKSQSTLKSEHAKFFVRNLYFHLIILFILFISLIYIFF